MSENVLDLEEHEEDTLVWRRSQRGVRDGSRRQGAGTVVLVEVVWR